jgi:hypothetical protein
MIADNAKIQADSARMKVEAHITCARMQQKDTDIALAIDRLKAEKRRLDREVLKLVEAELEEAPEPATKRSKAMTMKLGLLKEQIQQEVLA